MKEGLRVWKRGRFKMVGKRLKGKGRVRKGEGVSMVKGVEGVHPISRKHSDSYIAKKRS
jgi:hypothetical protein